MEQPQPSVSVEPFPEGQKWHPGQEYTVILFYRYAQLSPSFLSSFIPRAHAECSTLGLAGRILLAEEGVNGTLAGSEAAITRFIRFFQSSSPVFSTIDWKRSTAIAQHLPFPDLYVKQLQEIINTGIARPLLDSFVHFDSSTFGGLAPESTGVHLTPEEFHAALASSKSSSAAAGDSNTSEPKTSADDEEPLIVDIRNNYEYDVGHFDGAVKVDVTVYPDTWRELETIIEQHKLRENSKKVYMYCTGGIRCEKASAYIRAQGLSADRVFQLQGGIHRYLEAFPDGGLFKGRNMVFDSRQTMVGAAAADAPSSSCAVSSCVYCAKEDDTLTSRCAVCNGIVRVCRTCESGCMHGEYHCAKHASLRGLYFVKLEQFGEEELKRQLAGLQQQLLKLEGHNEKNRRRTLRRQIEKIQARLRQLRQGVAGCKCCGGCA